MINIEYKLPNGDLASRNRAIDKRKSIENLVKDQKHLLINCNEVLSISESYADEIFGVLVVKYGLEFVLEKLTIINASKHVLKSIASVIDRRHKEARTKTQFV